MRHSTGAYAIKMAPPKRRTALLILTIATLLAACSSPGGGVQKPDPTPAIDAPRQELPGASRHDLPPSEFSEQFRQAEQSLFEFDWMTAETILSTIPPEQRTTTDNQYLAYLSARILYTRGDQTGAEQALATLGAGPVSAAIRYKLVGFQRYTASLSGHSLRSAELGDQLLRVTAAGVESDALRRNIWLNLQRVDQRGLQHAIAAKPDTQWRGWLTLAQASGDSAPGPNHLEQVQQWRIDHPLHPAAQVLPGGMDFLLGNTQAIQKVAIMLPLSGRLAPASRAVRDGYLAEYYAARARGRASFDVEVLDILAYSTVSEAYRAATRGGADFVIGPLSKQAVAELGNLADRQVPVLALNRVEQVLPAADTALVQLALAPEDEAAQIARLAFGSGARQALLIRPAGSWGNKMERALRTQWQRLGGTIAATASYSGQEDYSSSMSAAMNLPGSNQRARGVRSMLATNVEFTARRRADLDVVFLLSKSGAEARSLKPLLAYHYASDLPVYATSNIYRGTPDSRDQDLNGIVLVETPWLLRLDAARAAIAAGHAGSLAYTRLNALGADAFLLQANFPALQAGEDMLLRGNTGLLTLTPQLHIQRELQSATFDGGALRPR